MKADNEKPLVLLSKNNAKTLLVRNAIDQATLKKEARLLEKERCSGERLFLKKKKHLLERHSKIMYEMGQRPLSSCSLPPENAVTKWNSETNLAGTLSPKPERKQTDGNVINTKRHRLLSLSSEGDDNQSSPRPRSKTFSSLTRSNSMISLPDIHATSPHGLTGEKKYIDEKRLWKVSNNQQTGDGLNAENVCVVDKWKDLRKCRYLRTCSAD